jgi:hypothetical protein
MEAMVIVAPQLLVMSTVRVMSPLGLSRVAPDVTRLHCGVAVGMGVSVGVGEGTVLVAVGVSEGVKVWLGVGVLLGAVVSEGV